MGQSVPAYGIVQSATPHMKMLRGWNPLNPAANRNKSLPTNGLTIASGQVISVNIVSSAEVWQIGVSASTAIPIFAYQDSDDFDVVASGGLTGVSTLDKNELQTAFFNASPTTPTECASRPTASLVTSPRPSPRIARPSGIFPAAPALWTSQPPILASRRMEADRSSC